MPRDCFADETAIDFPSVGHALERMRDGLVDERSSDEVVKADIVLSCREALDGRSVPVDVPMRELCARCGGHGETWNEPCASCGGTGASIARRRVRVAVPRGVADGATLRFRVSSPDAESVRVEARVTVRVLPR